MQEEWRVISAYPDYEITRGGRVRKRYTEEEVPTYQSRTKIDEPVHTRVRLLSNGVPYALGVYLLVSRAFPEMARKTKKANKPRAAESEFKAISVRPSADFRRLPEFPKYEISADGELRNWWSKKKLNLKQNTVTGAWSFSLRRNDGRSTQRSKESLLKSAYPENFPEKTVALAEPKRSYSTRGQWVVIPGFSKYEAHPSGKVRYTISRAHRRLLHDSTGAPYYDLFNDEGDCIQMRVRKVLREVFPETLETEKAS